MSGAFDPESGSNSEGDENRRLAGRVRRFLLGAPRDLSDKRTFHHLSVIAFLAWVGLGADGLSSSSYGPEEAFRTLGDHIYLAVPIALMMIATVTIISACYSRIIERFPHGGGGYVVATALLGKKAGVVSGSALLIDYVLTITVSIAAAGDALFSLLPPEWQGIKLWIEIMLIVGLTFTNIRGVKESILMLMPVFLLFIATHIILIGGAVAAHIDVLPETAQEVQRGFSSGIEMLGLGGMVLLFLHAYSLGGGTYTGIEAVSNGLPIMREPRVKTARRTMIYMAVSLAFMAAGLVICYLLWEIQVTTGKTMNAVLAERVAESLSLGNVFVMVTLVAEGALLVVAAQAGFIDGPRVLASMATDSWAPRRFSSLSDRLTTRNGIVLMGLAALAALLYTGGDVRALVVMYSINVFLTFSLSMLGMSRFLFGQRKSGQPWKGQLTLFVVGFLFCITVLVITSFEKFSEGGWITLLVTGTVVFLCFQIKRHYLILNSKLASLYESLMQIPHGPKKDPGQVEPSKPTAAILVGGYSGLGIHTMLSALKAFPGQFKNVVFLSVAVVDSNAIRGTDTLEQLRERTLVELKKYIDLIHSEGIPATCRMAVGTDVVAELEELCLDVMKEFPQLTIFAGQLVFQRERWYQAILHNETAFALQRRLQQVGQMVVIIPARVH